MTFGPVKQIRDFLAQFPESMTIGELLRTIDAMLPTAEATCKQCGKPITDAGGGMAWVHEDGSRGCRAASFNPDREEGVSAWDDSIPRSWMAEPE
jgi:hypothetical protein